VTSWKTEVRTDAGVFADLSEWWDAQRSAKENPYLNSQIAACWEEGFDEDSSRRHVRLLYRNGELVAGIPLYRSGGRLRTPLRAEAYWIDVIAIDDEEVTAHLPRWLDEVAIAHLYRFRSDSVLVRAVDHRPRWSIQGSLRSPYVDLKYDVDQIRAAASPRFVAGLRRRRRRLEEMGEVTFVEHPGSSEVLAVLEAGLRLEAAGWKGDQGVAVLNDPSIERWYRAMSDVAEANGWLRLSHLLLDGRMIAFASSLEYGGRRFGLKNAYDESPEIARCSPGNLLFESMLEGLAGRGLETFELSFAGGDWKYRWTSKERLVYDVLIFGSGPVGRTLAAARRLKR